MLLKSIFISVVAPYLIGSIPCAVWVGHFFSGTDVRNVGSRNAGATNIYRMLGIGPAILVFLFDAGKGALVVWICWKLNLSFPWVIPAAFFAIAGHVYPVFAHFSGGKGISTAAGVLALVDPLALLLALILFVLIVWRFRLVSAASLTAASVAFLTTISEMILLRDPWIPVLITGLFLVMIIYTHRSNILRLKSGQESKI